jgi:hypothetical protein
VSLVAASLDSVAVHVAFAHRPSRRCPSRPSTTPLGTALVSHGARHGAPTAATTALGTALGTEDVAIYRKVVALLVDDSEVALSLLSRIAPRDGIDSGCHWHAATWSSPQASAGWVSGIIGAEH